MNNKTAILKVITKIFLCKKKKHFNMKNIMQRAPLTFLSNAAKFIMYKDIFYVFNITLSCIYFFQSIVTRRFHENKRVKEKYSHVFHNIFH